MMIRSMGAGERFIPQSLMLKVLAEPDEKGYYHYLLAQALLSHLQHNQLDTNVLIDVDWENTILSQFGPQVTSLHLCMLHACMHEWRQRMHFASLCRRRQHDHLPYSRSVSV